MPQYKVIYDIYKISINTDFNTKLATKIILNPKCYSDHTHQPVILVVNVPF